MKISSASKKVLASALSAAMVVAFAPTVAFGAVAANQTVTVKFDTTGLVLQNGKAHVQDFQAVTANVDANTVSVAVESTRTVAGQYKDAAGNEVTAWFYDANGNGVYDTTVDSTFNAANAGTINIAKTADLEGATVVLKPYVAEAFTVSGMPTTAVQKAADGHGWFTATMSTSATYSAVLTKDGSKISEKTAAGTDIAFSFKKGATDAEKAAGTVDTADYGKGTYVLTVKNVVTGKTTIRKFEVVEFTLNGIFKDDGINHVGQKIKAIKGQTVGAAIASASGSVDVFAAKTVEESNAGTNQAQSYSLNGAVADGLEAANDMVLGPVYAGTSLAALSFANGTITLDGSYMDASSDYKAVLTGNGIEKTVPFVSDTYGKTAAAVSLYSWGDATAPTGTYNVVVYKVADKGLTTETATKVSEAAITLATVTFDAGEGKTTAKPVVEETGSVLSDIANGKTATATDKTAVFVGWSLDGVNVLKSTDKLTGDVTLKAIYNSTKVAVPTYTWASDTLTLASDAGTGYKVQYFYAADLSKLNLGAGTYDSNTIVYSDYTGPVQLKANATATETAVVAKVVKKAGATDAKAGSDTIVIKSSYTAKNQVSNFANDLVTTTSDSTKTAPKYYSVELKGAVEAAEKAITDEAYSADWAKSVLAQKTAIMKAVGDYEKAVIDTYAAGVAQADGSLKKLDASAAEKAKAAIDLVLQDFDYSNDPVEAKTTPSKNYANTAAFIADINKAAKDAAAAAVTYAKADVDAAAAVTAQLKAAKTADEAAAALAAYANLTDTQKALVAVADVKAAETVAAEGTQAALVKAQDKAAAATGKAQVKGTTYKIKAKGSKTIKIAKSASGAKVTLKQVSGTKYAKVSGTKVTLKKAAKKGKKYTIKVKAVCGATTTSTVSFKVLVK